MTTPSYPKLKPTLWDAIVVIAVILLSVVTTIVFYGKKVSSDQLVVVITAGDEVTRLPLLSFPDDEMIYTHNGYSVHVRADHSPDAVYVAQADCPTQDCVHTGKITRAGQSIICLPAQIIIHLEGSQSGTPDLILG